MFKQLLEFIDSLVTDFSWRKTGVFTALVVTVVSFGVFFEIYTQTFGLARLDKQLTLIERLYELDEKNGLSSRDNNLKKTYTELSNRLNESIGESGGLVPLWLKKYIASYIAWGLLAILIWVVSSKDKENTTNNAATAKGILILALPVALLFILVPFYGPWINYFFIPVAQIVAISILALLYSKKK